MNAFKDYVISEFKIDGTTSISFKFSHVLTTKIDKATKKIMNNHTINVVAQFYDKDLNLLRKETLKFVNNVLTKKDAERLVNIAPKELENRFNFARRDIVGEIKDDYLSKMRDINDKIEALNMYENVRGNETIPSEFKGELVQFKDSNQTTKPKFDM
jgi:hypothetical protein